MTGIERGIVIEIGIVTEIGTVAVKENDATPVVLMMKRSGERNHDAKACQPFV